MAESAMNYFPSQAVSDLEKMTYEYGLKVARAIEHEWFSESNNKYLNTKNNFHNLRLYARGEQPIQKYKDELSINGDLSYLNLDWKPVPIVPKFVDIVVNGMAQRAYDVKAYSQDSYGVAQRTDYMDSIIKDMEAKTFNNLVKGTMGIDLFENDPNMLPETREELELHMQLEYKQAVELAEEQAINVLMDGSKFDLIKRRCLYDLTTIGIGAVKTTFDFSEGAKVEYVDPVNSPYFDDLYYVGEVKEVPINELVKEFPELTEQDVKEIVEGPRSSMKSYQNSKRGRYNQDRNKVDVLYFNYKTHKNNTYKIKETGTGAERAIEKDDTFNPPADMEGNFVKLERVVECLYEGVLILGTDKLLKWGMAKNMMRNKSNFEKVKMNYSIVAPRMYEGRIESTVSRITGFADMIQLTHLKLQQVLSRMVPDGVYLDADGLAEIDLGSY
jgi:hypothetical protein